MEMRAAPVHIWRAQRPQPQARNSPCAPANMVSGCQPPVRAAG